MTLWILGGIVLIVLFVAGRFLTAYEQAEDLSTLPAPQFQPSPSVDAVILIVIDTLRADRLSCYGYTENQTPHIDRAAEKGVRFTRAHTVASWTCPSMGAMLTSLYPGQLGMLERPVATGVRHEWRQHRPQLSMIIPPYAPTIAQMMKGQGFTTAAFVNQPALNATQSFARGFGEYFFPISKDELGCIKPEAGQRVFQAWATNNFTAVTDEKLVDQFVDWLAVHGQEKIFAWVHLLAPHVPYAPPAAFAPPPSPDGTPPSNSQLYNGEVRFTDALVGRLLDAIKEHVHLDRVAVILTADHGEEFEDHQLFGHGHSFYREVNRVPLIVMAPSLFEPAVVESDVRIVDIVPTILEMTDLGELSSGLSGTALASTITGTSKPLPTFAEGKLYGDTQRCLIDDGFKLITTEVDDRCELYDVVADPKELNDLAARDAERVAVLKNRLQQWKVQMERYRKQAKKAIPRPNPREADQQRIRTMKALRSLGYVGGQDDE